MIVPIATPVGALYLAEPGLMLAAGVTLMRQRSHLRLPPLIYAAVGMLAVLGIYVIKGHHGGLGYVQAQARVVIVLISLLTLIRNGRVPSHFLLTVLMKAAVFLAILLAAERLVGITWDSTKLFATIDRSYRVSGPLGPGATASVLLAAGYVGVVRRQNLVIACTMLGLLLLASRAHLVAAGVVFTTMLAAGRLRPRQLIGLTVIVLGAAWLVPSGVQRLLAASHGAERSRARLGLWEEIFRITSWEDIWMGLGPGSLSYRVDELAVARQAHSQFLSPWVDLGLAGILGFGAMVVLLWRRSGANGTRPYLVGWLVLCVFGEFMFAPTMPLMLGAIPSWIVVMVGVDGTQPAQDKPKRIRRFMADEGRRPLDHHLAVH